MTTRFNLGKLAPAGSDPLTAVIDLGAQGGAREYHYADMEAMANGIARLLDKLDVAIGAHVGIASLNRAEYLAAYFGIMRAGRVAVPLNIKLPIDTLAYIVEDADLQLVFADAPRVAAFQGRAPIVVDFDDAGPDGFRQQVEPVDYYEVFAPGANDVAQMLYTSGSTGKPKGVQLSHAGQIWALEATLPPSSVGGERVLIAQPLFHMNGLITAKRCFAGGHMIVLQPAYDTQAYAQALHDYRITMLTAVPTMFARLLNHPELLEGKDFSALKRLTLSSAPMTATLFDRVRTLLPHAFIRYGYGTTEAGAGMFGMHPDGLPLPQLSLGYPLPDLEWRLQDAAGEANEQEGELVVRCPAVMLGYHNNPEATAKVLDADGWYHTGDVLRRDPQGFFYFVGRADDMFVCSGENIYPGEVEKMLERHPGIRQACVVPMQDEERGAVPVAFILRARGSGLTEDDVRQYALANGPAYQHPRRTVFVEDFPLAGTNKVDRAVLIRQAAELRSESA